MECKIGIVGSAEVDKLKLALRFVFQEEKRYDMEETLEKTVNMDNMKFKVEIIDISGQEDYVSLRDMYIRAMDGFLLVYSTSSQESFDDLESLSRQIERGKEWPIPRILVGVSTDGYEQKVSTVQGTNKAHQWGVPFAEVSPDSYEQIELAFETLIRDIHKYSACKIRSEKKPSFFKILKSLKHSRHKH